MTKQRDPAGPARIAVYRRVSTNQQSEDGMSLDVQLSKCIEEADRVYGQNLYQHDDFCDRGYSGSLGLRQNNPKKTKHRPALSDMMKGVAQGRYDAVVVYRLDRLFRSVALASRVLRDYLQEYGVDLVSVTESIDTSTPQGKAMLYVMVVMAEYFLDWSSQNITGTLRELREDGCFLGGIVPYGWRRPTREEAQDRVHHEIVRDEEQGRWLVQMKNWFMRGWGFRRIVKGLHEAGVPSPTGMEWWRMDVVRQLLVNPAHAGLISVGDGTTVEGNHYEHRYWDETTLQQIEQKMEERAHKAPATLSAAHYPLADVLTCGHCGKPMSGRRMVQRGKLYYRCTAKMHQREEQCGKNSQETELVERAVLMAVEKLLDREDIQELLHREIRGLLMSEDESLKEEAERLADELDNVKAQIDRWSDLYARGSIPVETLEAKSEGLHSRKAELKHALSEAKAQFEQRELRSKQLHEATERLQRLPDVWERLNFDERREMFNSVVEHCEMSQLDNGDTRVKVKLLIGDEYEFTIPRRHGREPDELTVRQLALLKLAHQGKTAEEIAQAWDVSNRSVAVTIGTIKKKLEVNTLQDAWKLAKDQIDKYEGWLPLEGRMHRRNAPDKGPHLTETQKRVIVLRAKGTHVRTIAKELDIAVNTVYVHLSNIRNAMGTDTDREACEKAIRYGLIDCDEEIELRLRPRQKAYLHLKREGLSDGEIAERFDVSEARVTQCRKDALERIGVDNVEDAIQEAADLIDDELDDLPLGPLPKKRRQQGLSRKTVEVLKLRYENTSYADMADTLGITEPTIGYHLRRAKDHFGVDTPQEAVDKAKEEGVI